MAADETKKIVNTTELTWEDFILALNLMHNTVHSSVITYSPYKAFYGYQPRIPKSNLESTSTPHSFATEEFLIFKKAVEQTVKEAISQDKDYLEKCAKFQLQQPVMFPEYSFREEIWTVPVF